MNLISINSIKEIAEDMPLCSYFLETRKKAKFKSVLSWLSTCDIDTLKLINQIYENNRMIPEETNKKATINTPIDVLDTVGTDVVNTDSFIDIDNEKDQMLDDEWDLMYLTMLILAWEHNTETVNTDIIDNAVDRLATYTAIATLIKQDLVVFVGGTGMLFDTKGVVKKPKNFRKKVNSLTRK